MKTCSRCGEEKPLEEFHLGGRGADGRQVWCKACRKVYDRQYHLKTKHIRIVQKRVWKRQSFEWLRGLKMAPCADCGGSFHPVAMQFDHRPGTVKEFDVSHGNARYSRKRVLAEIAKCDLVCANCHAVRTHRRRIGA